MGGKMNKLAEQLFKMNTMDWINKNLKTKNDAMEKLLKKLSQNVYKSDLHSFKSRFSFGIVFVTAKDDGMFWVRECLDSGEEKGYKSSIDKLKERLVYLGINEIDM